jgi:hypothetical protein
VAAPPSLPPCCTDDEIRDALRRVLGSAVFLAAPSLTAFLRFVVERTLAGEGGRIKGYSIGVDALGRSADFDPGSDPIVRVEAGRLRRRLERYYGHNGADDPVMIELVRGSYVPCFRSRVPRPPQCLAGPDVLDVNDIVAISALLEKLLTLRRRRIAELAAEIERAQELLERSRALLCTTA